ncbi:MAG: hypothetical protein K6B75_08420 [Lachnospiraceae bacterium]|nr:hypothetical protein [Lachnospiraceae bacterium]
MYFKHYDQAEIFMKRDIEDIIRSYGKISYTSEDSFDVAKGVLKRWERVVTKDGVNFSWDIIEGYFMDHINQTIRK